VAAARLRRPGHGGVTYGTAGFVSVGTAGFIIRSTNARSWEQVESGTLEDFFGVAFGDGLYVAVTASGGVFASHDSRTWDRVFSRAAWLSDVVYGHGRFVTVGAGVALNSKDGRHWVEAPRGSIGAMRAVTFGKSRFLATGGPGEVFVSKDGVAWSRAAYPSVEQLWRPAYGLGMYVVVGPAGLINTSRNRKRWTARSCIVAVDPRKQRDVSHTARGRRRRRRADRGRRRRSPARLERRRDLDDASLSDGRGAGRDYLRPSRLCRRGGRDAIAVSADGDEWTTVSVTGRGPVERSPRARADRIESDRRLSKVMTFEEILEQAIATLRRRRRVAYRALKVQLDLDDDVLEALKDELVYAQRVARDEDGPCPRVVWR